METFLFELVDELSIETDILCITETWLSEVELANINIEGFSPLASSSRHEQKGGGVAILVKDNLISHYYKLDLNTPNQQLHFEYCSIANDKSNTVLICVFKSNNGNSNINTFFKSLGSLLEEIEYGKKIILVGDFNIDT